MELPFVRHLLVSLGASYDLTAPITPYSLHHLVFAMKPGQGLGYPLVLSEMWMFARIEAVGDHEFWAEVYRLEDSEDELMAAYGPFVVPFGSGSAVSRAWCLRGVPFPVPGWYEFRLSCGGHVVATEPVSLEV